MDAQDTRTAQERIDQAEGRLAALQEQGIDTAGLNSQLAFARASLAQGRTLDVMAICEEVILSAKRLLSQPPVAVTRPVKSERIVTPVDAPQTATHPPPGGVTESADERRRLTDEIRQAVQADLAPKTLSPAQVDERIRVSLQQSLEQQFSLLQEQLSSRLELRFQRLAAEPSTHTYPKTDNSAELDELEARLAAAFDQHLEARTRHLNEQAAHSVTAAELVESEERLAAAFDQHLEARAIHIGQQTASALAAATAEMKTQLADIADPQRQQAFITAAVEALITPFIAHAEEDRQRTNAQLEATLNAVDTALPAAIAQALAAALPSTVATTVATVVQAVLPSAVNDSVHAAMASVTETVTETVTEAVATPVRELIAEALSKAAEHNAPADLEALTTRLGNDLRADLDWQIQRLAAEKGWVTLADVHSELRTSGGAKPASEPSSGPGFARLEAALVEFVRQTQSQQQQFLNVLQKRVEEGTAVVALNVAKALGVEPHRSSTTFHPPAKSAAGVSSMPARPLASVAPEPSVLESLAAAPLLREGDLDVLTMSDQHRALGTRLVTPPTSAALVKETTAENSAAPQPATRSRTGDEISSACRPSTMLFANSSGVDNSAWSPQPAAIVDPGITTSVGTRQELDTDVLEMNPLGGSTDELASVQDPLTQKTMGVNRQPLMAQNAENADAEPFPSSADDRQTTRVVTEALDPTAASAATAASPGTAATTPKTSRVEAFTSGLRNLVKDEVQRQLASESTKVTASSSNSTPAVVEKALPLADLEERIRIGVEKALAELTERRPSNAEVRLTVPCDTDLRAAITRSMPDMLHDPAIRQQILGVVAVEAIANPGALGELTGIRAFIRAEVGQARLDKRQPEKESEIAPSENREAREHATTLLS